MDVRKIILATFVLLLAANVIAATCANNDDPGIGKVSITKAEHSKACVQFKWSYTATTLHASMDRNGYTVNVSGGRVGTGDYNTNATEYWACTVDGGEKINITVIGYDGNKEGHFCTNDANASVTIGESADAAKLLIYNLMLALAAIIVIVILLVVAVLVFKQTGIPLPKVK